MDLTAFFKKAVKALRGSGADFALAGGMVASIYRTNARTTNDLDFLIISESDTRKKAEAIILEFKLVPHVVRKADLEGGPMFAIKRKNTVPYIIAGRGKEGEQAFGLDFILPEMPWFEEAIKRAAYNKIDFGFGPIPCLTKEDVIISKLYSLMNDQSRFNDLDDLKAIFQAGHEIDIAYISGQMHKLRLIVPASLKDVAPKALLLISKRVRRKLRKTTDSKHNSQRFRD